MVSLLDRAENAGALLYLAHGRPDDEADSGPPAEDVDRRHLGTHPAIVDWLWDTLNAALPVNSRWLVFDGPALVHPPSGVILAAGIGSQYVLRLRVEDVEHATSRGAEVIHAFRTVGATLDLPAAFGAEWVFGHFDDRERGWLRASYKEITA